MKIDYHMHFERGSYDFGWVQGFFDAAERRGLDEIGISEHSHGFTDFEHFYYDDLILDEQQKNSRGYTSVIDKSKYLGAIGVCATDLRWQTCCAV